MYFYKELFLIINMIWHGSIETLTILLLIFICFSLFKMSQIIYLWWAWNMLVRPGHPWNYRVFPAPALKWWDNWLAATYLLILTILMKHWNVLIINYVFCAIKDYKNVVILQYLTCSQEQRLKTKWTHI